MRYLKADRARTEQIGEVAAHALEEIHRALYGRAPEATRSWTDGDAILLIVRTAAPNGTVAPVSEIQQLVGAAVQRRTGVALRAGGVNVDADRELAVLAFERIETPAGPQRPVGAGPVPGAG